MSPDVWSFSLILLALWHANDGSLRKEMSEDKPANHLNNISDEDLRVDLEMHNDEYDNFNGIQYYDLLNKQLDEQFGESNRTYTKEYYDNIEQMPNTKITSLGITTLGTLPSQELKIGIGADHIINIPETGEKNESTSVKPLDNDDYSTEADKVDTGIKLFRVSVARIYHSTLIWMSVYTLLAVPFWCIKGWCCCCLRCKFFKPQETIQEAKDYLLLNPPGVLVTKKGAIIHYEPTEREKDCYEEFGHFMRTL